MTEGTPDLGVTSYWTDVEGNVVFGANTQEEKMKTAITGMTKGRKVTMEPYDIFHQNVFLPFIESAAAAEKMDNLTKKPEEEEEIAVQEMCMNEEI